MTKPDEPEAPKPEEQPEGQSLLGLDGVDDGLEAEVAAEQTYDHLDDHPDGDLDDELEGVETYPTGNRAKKVRKALYRGKHDKIRKFMGKLHPAEQADLLESLDNDERLKVLDVLGEHLEPETFAELDETVRDDVVDHMGHEKIADVIAELDSDDAIEVIEVLDEADQKGILDAIPAEDRTIIEETLSFPEESAGRLMQRELVAVPEHWTIGQTIDFMRANADDEEADLPEVFYDIFVVDPAHKPVGMVGLSRVLQAKRSARIIDLKLDDHDMQVIPVTMDQEEVAYVFRKRDMTSAPVVDDGGRLVGAITIDDVVDVIHEEFEEDLMRLGGVQEDDLYSAAVDTTKSRFTWLLVNLGTAVLASWVISMFEGTLDQIVALAILMPIVASMGGNAGTQALTVAVRSLATRELTAANAMRVVFKEVIVGGINGILFAILIGVIAWLWFNDPYIGSVIAMAMVVNMLVAGLAGVTIPLLLDKMGADPAISSSIFLTTVTDVVGFAAFLGLASWLIL